MGSVEKQGIGNAWPVGFGFRPTDDELINHHLARKLRGLEEASQVIPVLNIYQWEPQALFQKYNELSNYPSDGGECFFYCTRDGKNRKTQGGFWKETRNKRSFRDRDGKEIGSKRIFVYHEGRQPCGRKSPFSMHEYHLNYFFNTMIGADHGPAMEFVLCRIINRKVKKITPDSPSECLEPDLVTPGCTPNNHQGDKDNEAIPQVSKRPRTGRFIPVSGRIEYNECLEPDLVTPVCTPNNHQGDMVNEAIPQVCDPQHHLTEAEAGGHGDGSVTTLLQYDEPFSEHLLFTYNDQFDDPVYYRDNGSDDGISISDLWD